MPDPLGLAQTILDGAREVFGWWVDEGGRIEAKKRATLRAKREECRKALIDNDWARLKRLTEEMERLANES